MFLAGQTLFQKHLRTPAKIRPHISIKIGDPLGKWKTPWENERPLGKMKDPLGKWKIIGSVCLLFLNVLGWEWGTCSIQLHSYRP